MANEVKIILTAVDKASAVLKSADTAAGGLGSSLKTLALSAGAVGIAYKAFDFLKGSITDTVKYAETVRDLGRALGTNAEESSKLIQLADDLKIDQAQLELAFRFALTKGVRPSIEGLKELAVEYQLIQDPVAKAQFAMEKFGTRGGLQMQKVLELTTDEIDGMAQSAEDAGLILSDEGVAAAREYEKAMDSLGEVIEGVKITIGEGLIPAIVDTTEGFLDYVSKAVFVEKSAEMLNEAWKAGIITLEEKVQIIGDLAMGEANLNRINEIAHWTEVLLRDDRQESIIALRETKIATEEVADATRGAAGALDAHERAIRRSTKAADEGKEKMKAFLDILDADVGSPIASFIEDMQWWAAGGGKINEAFLALKEGVVSGAVSPAEAEAWGKELFVTTNDLQAELDMITADAAAQNVADTLGITLDEAKAKIAGTTGIEGALERISRGSWPVYIDVWYREHNKPPTLPSPGGDKEIPLEPGLESINPPAPTRTVTEGTIGTGGVSIQVYPSAGMDELAIANYTALVLSQRARRGAVAGAGYVGQ